MLAQLLLCVLQELRHLSTLSHHKMLAFEVLCHE